MRRRRTIKRTLPSITRAITAVEATTSRRCGFSLHVSLVDQRARHRGIQRLYVETTRGVSIIGRELDAMPDGVPPVGPLGIDIVRVNSTAQYIHCPAVPRVCRRRHRLRTEVNNHGLW